MRILLLKNIRGLGQKNEIKNVSDGYARNFLIAKGLGVIATEGVIKKQEQTRKDEIVAAEKKKEMLKKLAMTPIIFEINVGKDGSIFSSITKEMVKEKLQELGYKDTNIELERPIKTLGQHEIVVHGGLGIEIKIKITIKAKV